MTVKLGKSPKVEKKYTSVSASGTPRQIYANILSIKKYGRNTIMTSEK